MKLKILLPILVILISAGITSAALTAPTTNHVGAKISGSYWDLMGWMGIYNGSISKIYQITFKNNGTPAVSDANNATLYYDLATGKIKISENGSGYTNLNYNVTYAAYQGAMDAMNTSSNANRTYAQGVSNGINISVAALQANNIYFNGSVFPNSTTFRNDTIGTNASTQLRAVSNLTATYTLNTEYTSASGRPTMVFVTANFSTSTGGATLRAYTGTDPISGAVGVRFPTNTTNMSSQLVFITAANTAYAVNTTTTGDGVVTLEDWREVLVN